MITDQKALTKRPTRGGPRGAASRSSRSWAAWAGARKQRAFAPPGKDGPISKKSGPKSG